MLFVKGICPLSYFEENGVHVWKRTTFAHPVFLDFLDNRMFFFILCSCSMPRRILEKLTSIKRDGSVVRNFSAARRMQAGCLKLKQSNTSAGGPRRALNLSAELYSIMTYKSIHVVSRWEAASYYLQKYWACFLKAYWYFAGKNISLRMTKWRYSTNSLFWTYILADVLPFAKSCCGLRTMKENAALCAAAMLGLSRVAFCANLRKRRPLRPLLCR